MIYLLINYFVYGNVNKTRILLKAVVSVNVVIIFMKKAFYLLACKCKHTYFIIDVHNNALFCFHSHDFDRMHA